MSLTSKFFDHEGNPHVENLRETRQGAPKGAPQNQKLGQGRNDRLAAFTEAAKPMLKVSSFLTSSPSLSLPP